MSKSLLLMLCVLIGLLVLACARPAVDTNRNAAAPATATSPVPAGTPSTNTNATAGPIGIAECDSFLTAYDTCVSNKVPEAVRPQYKTAIATWRTEWKKLADNPQTRGTLANVCRQQMETARTQVKAFGCTF